MAEIDTGLGWAAKDTWLLQTTGTIANISELVGGLKLPQGDTVADCAIGGAVIGYRDQPLGTPPVIHRIEYKLMSVEYPAVVASLTHSNYMEYLSVSLVPGNHIIVVMYDTFDDTYTGSTYSMTSFQSKYIFNQVIPAGVYSEWTANPEVTDYPDANTLMSSISEVSSNITKANAGFSVACLARWKTNAQVIINTPILISSDSSFTDMVDASGQYNLAKLNILRQGMRFYMAFYDITGDTSVTGPLPVVDLTGPDENPRTLEQVFAIIAQLDNAAILVLNSPDPYGEEGGESGEEGGDGDEDPEDDPVEEETLPIPAVSGLGFSTIYVPTANDLYQLASYLWGGNLDLDNFLRLFANPMDSILGLSAVPVALSGTYEQIYLGGQQLQGVTMPRYSGRTAVKVDMGSVTISKRWGSYLDYDPYTEFSVYLPFIGIKNIKADDIMDKTVSLMYNIDILSGACVAYLRTAGGSVLYEWAGQCAMQIPITGSNWDNIFSTAISAALTLGGAMVAPASAPMLAGSVASAAVQAVAAKPRVERSGAVTGVTGFLGQLRPYIIRTIPEAYIPNDQNKFIGYPAYITVNLADVTGYNEVDSIHLEHVPATGAELDEIETLLKGGVIF